MNESEPSMRCREVGTTCQKLRSMKRSETSITETCLLVMRQASYRRQDFYLGLITELGKLYSNAKEKCTMGTTQRQNIEVLYKDGLIRSSNEVLVMSMERRD